MERFAATLILALASPVLADPAQVVGADYRPGRLAVTLLHGDTGWDDYADAWEVLSLDGESLGIRELAHPHVEEQPFTRTLSVTLPGDGPWQVLIRARDTQTGWSDPIAVTFE